MARKTKADTKQYEFINVDFSHSEREHYQKWTDRSPMDLSTIIMEIADQGWKLSLSYDARHEAYISSMTCKVNDQVHGHKIFMIRHADIDKLIRLSGYYFNEVLMNLSPEAAETDTYSW